jgi:hypothetical protein
VSINEDELIEHKSRVPQALIENPKLLRAKQEALRKAQVVPVKNHSKREGKTW